MNDGLLIEIVHGSHDPILEFLFGRDADVAEDGAGKFREEALDEVEPGAVLGSASSCPPPARSRQGIVARHGGTGHGGWGQGSR